ncbi:acetylornithine deacetylase [Tropicimonas marinistellae]|uniref:acetylornithine deacetylase n=1 Tax=Tropicimonas marinistellae TaxID=1739787 RepID=UPI0008347F42|nr:acetylornithine deacetylase [Tropicimonas marinistellae]
MRPETLLSDLVAFPTVAGRPNGALIDYVQTYLSDHGLASTVVEGEADRFNLFATIGPVDRSGYILSGHVDVVPAEEPEWQGDPFALRHVQDRLIGRGAVDMKGFVAAILSSVPDLMQLPLSRPIHIALSYDEEAGCRGVPYLIEELPTLCAPPLGCIVGEPSGMVPVLRHKGKATVKLTARGRPGHSSRPDLGRNAIHDLLPALLATAALPDQLQMSGRRHNAFEPPHSTVQIGTIHGGQAVNIIPDHVEALIEARAVPGDDPMDLLAPVLTTAQDNGAIAAEVVASYPALDLDEKAPLVSLLSSLTGTTPLAAVSFGTEAGLFQAAGIPSIICGPGDISRAHKPEEYIAVSELRAARELAIALGHAMTE